MTCTGPLSVLALLGFVACRCNVVQHPEVFTGQKARPDCTVGSADCYACMFACTCPYFHVTPKCMMRMCS